MEFKPNQIMLFEQQCRKLFDEWCIEHNIQIIEEPQCIWWREFNMIDDEYIFRGVVKLNEMAKAFAINVTYNTIEKTISTTPEILMHYICPNLLYALNNN